MKTWSKNWKKSARTRKQRKYNYFAPLHTRGKFLTSPLAKTLRDQTKKNNMRARKGDTVKILRGDYRGKEGVIERVNTRKGTVYVTGIEKVKKDGSKTLIPIHASKITITTLTPEKRR